MSGAVFAFARDPHTWGGMDNTAPAADSIAANTMQHGLKAPMEDLATSTRRGGDLMRSLSIKESPHCVLHPAESETFRRSVVAHCVAQSETLGKVAVIWLELISQSVAPSEGVAEIVRRTPLSAAQVRRRIHGIRTLSVAVLEDQIGGTAADD